MNGGSLLTVATLGGGWSVLLTSLLRMPIEDPLHRGNPIYWTVYTENPLYAGPPI